MDNIGYLVWDFTDTIIQLGIFITLWGIYKNIKK
jgi:hypothetical protein